MLVICVEYKSSSDGEAVRDERLLDTLFLTLSQEVFLNKRRRILQVGIGWLMAKKVLIAE